MAAMEVPVLWREGETPESWGWLMADERTRKRRMT
jgi:hypothetical protein